MPPLILLLTVRIILHLLTYNIVCRRAAVLPHRAADLVRVVLGPAAEDDAGLDVALRRALALAVSHAGRRLAEDVRLLAVHGEVADEQLLLGHAQGHAQHVLDEQQDGGRPEEVPGDDEEGADDLQADLAAEAVDGAARQAGAEGGDTLGRGEDPRAAAADDGGDEVGVEDAERVVEQLHKADLLGEQVHREPRHAAGAEGQADGAPAGYVAGGRRDGHEARDHAVDHAHQAGLAVVEVVAGHPDQHAERGAQVGVEHGHAGVRAGRVGVAAVEAVPAEPEDAGADERDDEVVGPVVLDVGLEARPDPVAADEAGRARRQVDDVAARVVDDAVLREEAAAPDAEGADGVAQRDPQRHVQHPREDVHAAEERAGRDDDGDGGEHELEVAHGGLRKLRHDRGVHGGQDGLLELELERDGLVGHSDEW